MSEAALVVIAKAPVAGRSKTRLSPPHTLEEAAILAQAALEDTLQAVAATPARRRVVALEGEPGGWLPPGFDVIPQRGGGLGERLAGAMADAGGPALVVGMDTPQVGPELLAYSLRRLAGPGADAVIGAAADGGYWAIGLQRPNGDEFAGVPMSSVRTGAEQRRRLEQLGLRYRELPPLRDVDTHEDALAVAAAHPHTRFAAELRACRLAA